jgi:Ca-activated chloride channel family protein
LKLSELPINLPAGWDFEKVFGERPHLPAPPTERRADADGKLQLAALKPPVAPAAPSTIVLPKTTTDAELSMLIGAALMMLSGMLLVLNRRRIIAW